MGLNGPEPGVSSGSRITRRRVLQLYAAGAVTVGAGALAIGELSGGPDRILPESTEVAEGEQRRAKTGRVRPYDLVAAPATIDLGGKLAHTWAFNGQLPRDAIRATPGDQLEVRVKNQLASSTSVHWHGLALRNDMDGVPNLTRQAIGAGSEFTYRFTCPDPGTYWFHPHVGVQLDTGLMGPLIIEDPSEPLNYDQDVTLMLDDWTDGLSQSPNQILSHLSSSGMNMGSMSGMDSMSPNSTGMGITQSQPLGNDTGDVDYPLHLINGKPPTDPFIIRARPGSRLRLRLINAGSDTAYRFQIGDHQLNVVHTDGYPVQSKTVDSLIIGMGERYDVIVRAGDGAFPIVSTPLGKKNPPALAILRSSATARKPKATSHAPGQVLQYQDLQPEASAALRKQNPARTVQVDLTMRSGGRQWLINGKTYADHTPLDIKSGERLRLEMTNRTMMFHPMHLHGHTFALVQSRRPGVRKDTINVLPMQRLAIDVQADNPGQWLLHCHNAYHGELGMMTVLSYVR